MYYHQPGGSSVKNVIHWLQIIGSDKIRHFDYGHSKNLEIYGQTIAPEYNFEILKNMTIDIFITSSKGDPYCLESDFKLMLETFKKSKVYTQEVGYYNHLDYLWGKNAHRDIYIHMLKFLNEL